MNDQIKLDVAKVLLHIEKQDENIERRQSVEITEASQKEEREQNPISEKQTPIVNTEKKVGRNDPCPCGSGKKYKNCCGRN